MTTAEIVRTFNRLFTVERCYIEQELTDRAAVFSDALADFSGVFNYAEAFQFEGLPK